MHGCGCVCVSACAFVASFGPPRHYYFIFIFGFLFQEPLVAEMVFCSRVLSFLFFFLYDIFIRLCGFFLSMRLSGLLSIDHF